MGLCRRIHPDIITLSWSWLIRSEPKSPPNEPLAPNARSQAHGLKTPTQHPTSASRQSARLRITTSTIYCDRVFLHRCTAALHVSSQIRWW
jgi:hypothetical protein